MACGLLAGVLRSGPAEAAELAEPAASAASAQPAAPLEPAEPRPLPVRIEWEGPDACGSESFVRELERYFPEVSEGIAAAEVAVTVVERGAGFRLQLQLVQGQVRTRRAFDAEQCATVSEAAAFVAAVTIDPSVMDRLERAEPEPEPAPVPKPEPKPTPPLATEPAPAPTPRPRPWRVRVASGPAGLGLPGVGAVVRGAGSYVRRRFRVGLHGSYRSPGEARSPIVSEAGGRLSLWALGARGCWTPRWGSVSVPICVGAEGGQVLGRGFGFDGAKTSGLPWVAVVPAAELVWSPGPTRWRRLALVVGVEPAVVIGRHTFVIEGLGPVYALGPVSLRGLLGLEIALGSNKGTRISR